MPSKFFRLSLFALVILAVAAGTTLFWWLVLSEDSVVEERQVAPQAPSVQQFSGAPRETVTPTSFSDISHSPSNSLFHVEPYLQYPTPTAISILWETAEPATGEVEFGETESLGNRVVESDKPRTFHEVRLTGLQPGKRYHYRVKSGGAVSPVYTFRTAPPEGTKRWRLAVYGDSRSNPAVHRAIVEQIARHQVDLIVHTGDMVTNGKNHTSWAREFFAPLAPLLCRVPIIGVLGNHEGDSPYYFQYFALPGNERYYQFRYANARFFCLDSNVQISSDSKAGVSDSGKAAWAKEQLAWLQEQLRQLDDSTWNIVVFHHPLLSAHATRPISPLRWEWMPLLVNPKHHVDLVFNGHDHFYARSWPVSMYEDPPTRGVMFITTAGGGAPLYRTRPRDYIAAAVPVYHFTLLDFRDEELWLRVYSATGQALDRVVIRKGKPAADFFCWESELLRENIRRALAEMPAQSLQGERSRVESLVEVANPFHRPIGVRFRWAVPPGWRLPNQEWTELLQPGQKLKIPLQAEVHAEALHVLPRLHLELVPPRGQSTIVPAEKAPASDPGETSAVLPFRNRSVATYPFKLAGPDSYSLVAAQQINVDGQANEPEWKRAAVVRLPRVGFGAFGASGDPIGWLAAGFGAPRGTRASLPERSSDWPIIGKPIPWQLPEKPPEVRLAATPQQLFALVQVRDSARHISVQPPDSVRQSSSLVLYDNHVRLELFDGKKVFSYALSAENVPYCAGDGKAEQETWAGVSTHDGQMWTTELAIPLQAWHDRTNLRINVVVYLKKGAVQFEWRPDRLALTDTEWLPVWDLRGPSRARSFARLLWP